MKGSQVTILILSIVSIIGGLMWGLPTYNVWSAEKSGQARLAEAEQSRQIQIEEAKANLESEKLNALSEVERAKGAAQAIEIENGSLTTEYIQYLWVRQQSNLNDKTVIYIPTEAQLPILEANRNIN